MKKLVVLIFLFSFIQVYSQCLPLQIGNQWHYTPFLAGYDKVLIATDTVNINDVKYFRIDYWSVDGSPVNGYFYDRMEGDSLYYRLYPTGDTLFLFNFNWTNEQIISTQVSDSCFRLLLIHRNDSTYLGVTATIYNSFLGVYCLGMTDTAWTSTSEDYSSFFGGIHTYFDGTLIGALIDGISYGTLYPVTVEDEIGLPTQFILEQNYPNPFNPTTKIKFTIPSVGTRHNASLKSDGVFIQLKVYDVLGNAVATLVDEFREAGSYEVTFDASGFASGIYFYELRSGEYIQSKKMTLIK